MVPKNRKANFTDRVAIEATCDIDESEREQIIHEINKNAALEIDANSFPKSVRIQKYFNFDKSEYINTGTVWSFSFEATKKRGTKTYTFDGSDNGQKEIWLIALRSLRKRIPIISYFPTFLFDFPDRIYLEAHEEESPQDQYYRQILQDILDADGSDLSLEEHVIARIKKRRESISNPFMLWAELLKYDDKSNIDAVFSRINVLITKVVFGKWNEIFDRKVSNKRVEIEWQLDTDSGVPFAEFKIYDGQSNYKLSERSLGFRWFFGFLLFTQFRQIRNKKRQTIFLFDEPASNLHARAQLQLLKSFPEIASDGNVVIYSTHSHYLIEPLWLEHAYIIENKAIDYDEEDDLENPFTERHTDIIASKYRTFVGKAGKRTSYFQPVLDKIDYIASPLVGDKDAVIVEGKSEFYAIMPYVLKSNRNWVVVPGDGAGNLHTPIRLFLGWGRSFIVLLDDDRAGRRELATYKAKWPNLIDRTFTLADVDPAFRGGALEKVYSTKFKEKVKLYYGLDGPPKKDDLSRYIFEKGGMAAFDKVTERRLEKIIEWIDQNINSSKSVE